MLLFPGGVDLQSDAVSRRDNFAQQFPHQTFPTCTGKKLVGCQTGLSRDVRIVDTRLHRVDPSSTRHPHTVERDVPCELLPVGSGEIIGNLARDTRIPKQCREIMSAGFRPSLEFTHHHVTMRQMLNHPGLEPIQTNKAKPSQDLLCRKEPGQRLFITKTILKGEQRGVSSDQWFQQSRQLRVRGALQSDDHPVAHSDLLWSSCALGTKSKITVGAFDPDAVASNGLVIGAKQKMHLLPEVREPSAIVAAESTAAHHADLQGAGFDARLTKFRHGWGAKAAGTLKIKKGTLKKSECLERIQADYFLPRIESFAAFATRNFTTFLAGIWMTSPVAGLRP